MYPRFLYLNLNHRKIESVTFAALKGCHRHNPCDKTPLCNWTSGILTRFSEKTSPSRQIFNQVAPFCQVAILPFLNTNDIRWVCENRTGEATN